MLFRGYSSAGRALEWHSRGQRFDPAYLHHSMFYGLYSTEYKPFYFPKNKYRDDAGSFHRHSSILPLLKKAVSTFIQKIVRAAFFCCPEMCLTVRHNSSTNWNLLNSNLYFLLESIPHSFFTICGSTRSNFCYCITC